MLVFISLSRLFIIIFLISCDIFGAGGARFQHAAEQCQIVLKSASHSPKVFSGVLAEFKKAYFEATIRESRKKTATMLAGMIQSVTGVEEKEATIKKFIKRAYGAYVDPIRQDDISLLLEDCKTFIFEQIIRCYDPTYDKKAPAKQAPKRGSPKVTKQQEEKGPAALHIEQEEDFNAQTELLWGRLQSRFNFGKRTESRYAFARD